MITQIQKQEMIVMWIPLLNLPLRTGRSDSFKDPLISFIFGCKKKYIYELLQLIMASYSNLIPGSFISKMSFIFVPSCWNSLHKVFKCKPALWMYMFLSKTTLNGIAVPKLISETVTILLYGACESCLCLFCAWFFIAWSSTKKGRYFLVLDNFYFHYNVFTIFLFKYLSRLSRDNWYFNISFKNLSCCFC